MRAIRRLDGIRCGSPPAQLKRYKGSRTPGRMRPGVSASGEPVKLGNLLVRQLCRVQGERLAIVAYRPCELSDIVEALSSVTPRKIPSPSVPKYT